MLLNALDTNPLHKLSSISILSLLLGIKKERLLSTCYTDTDKYRSFTIPKKRGGVREIDSPVAELKLIQERLAVLLSTNITFNKKCVQGFIKGRGIRSNADFHKKSKRVLNIDIKDFFGTINFGRVRGILIAKPFEMNPKVATVIAQICTYKNRLPQGAPTSPVISNIFGSLLDNKIIQHIKREHLLYTRYVDDITISSKGSFPPDLAYIVDGMTIIGEKLKGIFSKCDFEINDRKARLQLSNTRQEVTGLVVNKKINIPIEYKNKLRAAIKQWCDDPQTAERKYYTEILKIPNKSFNPSPNGERLRKHIYGRLSFMKMVKGEDDPTYIRLVLKMIEKDAVPPKFTQEIKKEYQMYDVFLCHASEDKDTIAIPLYKSLQKKKLSPFIDEKNIQWGDSLPDIIGRALVQSKYVIAILTENSIEKAWPRKEINAVLSEEIKNGKKKLLPLVNEKGKGLLDSHYLIKDKLYVEWMNNPDEIADKILNLIHPI